MASNEHTVEASDDAKFTVCRVTVNRSDQLAGHLSVRPPWGQVKGTDQGIRL